MPAAGFSNEKFAILTNDYFTAPGSITAIFTWDPSLVGGPPTAQDFVRLVPLDVVIRVTYTPLGTPQPAQPTGPACDLVELTSTVPPQIYWATAWAKMSGLPAAPVTVVLTNPANPPNPQQLGFAASKNGNPAPAQTLTLTLGGNNNAWVPFCIAGNAQSNAVGDAVIVPQDAGGNPFTSHPMTVFWYDNAQLTITPKDDYNKMRQRMVAVTFSGAVTVRPDGMPAGAPALMALRLAFIQNGSFNRTYTYAMPFAVWARSLAVNQRHIPPTFSYNGAGTEAITLPTQLDMVDGSISPVYNSKGRAMKHPAGSPLVANIHSSDTPLAGSLPPARVLIPGKSVNSNPPQGSFIVWPQTRVVLADNFQTWLVVTHAGGNGQLPAGAPYTARCSSAAGN